MKGNHPDSAAVVEGIIQYLSEEGTEDLIHEVSETLVKKTEITDQFSHVLVKSAVPLNDSRKKDIESAMNRILPKKKIPFTYEIDSKLIGEFTIRMGDMFIDASVKRDLLSVTRLLLS